MNWTLTLNLKIVVIISAYFMASVISAYCIKLMLKKYEKDIQDNGLKSAGMIIGMIERIIILTFVLVNEYTAITIIFAAKSIARFNELKIREIAEYYLIGTLLSISFAMFIGIVTRLIMGL